MTDATCNFCGAESHDHRAISCFLNLLSQRDEAREELRDLNEAFCVLNDSHIALRAERDEARRDTERLADVIRAALGAPIDIGELAGHCEGDAFFFDGYELARTRIDAALTQEDV